MKIIAFPPGVKKALFPVKKGFFVDNHMWIMWITVI